MRYRIDALARLLLALVVALGLSGCLHDDDDDGGASAPASATVSGTAATGAPLVGYVYVTDKNGTEINVRVGGDGSYSADVTGMSPPFMIRAVPDDTAQPTQYAYASRANVRVNITPLTTLALFLASNQSDLAAMAANWSSRSGEITTTALDAAKAVVNANLLAQYQAQGLDGTTYDFFSAPFKADGSGFDALLDTVKVSIDMKGGGITVTVNGAPHTFDPNIDTSAIRLGGGSGSGGGSGDWTLTVSGTVTNSMLGVPVDVDVPVSNVPAPPSASEMAQVIAGDYSGAGSVNVTVINDSADRKTFRVTFQLSASGVTMNYDLTYDYQRTGNSGGSGSGGNGSAGGGSTGGGSTGGTTTDAPYGTIQISGPDVDAGNVPARYSPSVMVEVFGLALNAQRKGRYYSLTVRENGATFQSTSSPYYYYKTDCPNGSCNMIWDKENRTIIFNDQELIPNDLLNNSATASIFFNGTLTY